MSGPHTVDQPQGMSAKEGGDKKSNEEQRPIIQWKFDKF